MEENNTKSAIEALLFISEKPLPVEQIRKIFVHLTPVEINAIVNELKTEYEQSHRGIRIYEVAGGFQLIAAPDYVQFLRKLGRDQHADKLSKPGLETLAIIAYKQPITKLEIQSLRNVNIDGVIKNLLEKNLIRIAGRKKAPGRPKVYGTTKEFLEYFGLNSLEDLPKIEKEDFAVSLTKKGDEGNDARETSQPN